MDTVKIIPPENYNAATAKVRASVLWLLAKAYHNKVPSDLRDPCYHDHGEERLKPQIVHALANADLYCLALANIYADPNHHTLNHQGVLQLLSRKGVELGSSPIQLTETILVQTAPLRIAAHMAVIEGIINLYIKEVLIPEKVLEVVRRYAPEAELPHGPEEAALLWINKSCVRLRHRVEAELGSSWQQSSPTNKVPSIPYVQDLSELSNGVSLVGLISFYCPTSIFWEGRSWGTGEQLKRDLRPCESLSDAIYHLILVREFCEQCLPADVCPLTLDDLLYADPALRPNLLAMLADLLYLFEIRPARCVTRPGMPPPAPPSTPPPAGVNGSHPHTIPTSSRAAADFRPIPDLRADYTPQRSPSPQQQPQTNGKISRPSSSTTPGEARTRKAECGGGGGLRRTFSAHLAERPRHIPTSSAVDIPKRLPSPKMECVSPLGGSPLTNTPVSKPVLETLPNSHQGEGFLTPPSRKSPVWAEEFRLHPPSGPDNNHRITSFADLCKNRHGGGSSIANSPANNSFNIVYNTPVDPNVMQDIRHRLEERKNLIENRRQWKMPDPMAIEQLNASMANLQTGVDQKMTTYAPVPQPRFFLHSGNNERSEGYAPAAYEPHHQRPHWGQPSPPYPPAYLHYPSPYPSQGSFTLHPAPPTPDVPYPNSSSFATTFYTTPPPNITSSTPSHITYPPEPPPVQENNTTDICDGPNSPTPVQEEFSRPNKLQISSSPPSKPVLGKTFRVHRPKVLTPSPPPTTNHSPSAETASPSSEDKGFYIALEDDEPRKPKPKLKPKHLKARHAEQIEAQQARNKSPVQSPSSPPPPAAPLASPEDEEGRGFVVGADLVEPDPQAELEMTRKKEMIMVMSLRRRAEQEARRALKEQENAHNREKERLKKEELERKKEEEKQRRQAILEQYRQKKAQQQETESSDGSGISRPETRTVTRPKSRSGSRPRPKTIHLGNSNPSLATPGSHHHPDLDSVSVQSLDLPCPARRMVPASPASLPLSLPHRPPSDGSDSSSLPPAPEYTGPKLFVKPSAKSNRGIITNAVNTVLAGAVNADTKRKVLQEIGNSDKKHFLILFRDGGCQFRGLYSYNPETEEVVKLYGVGPRHITPAMMDRFYKYNSGSKSFSPIQTKHLTVTIDAITIQNTLWGSARKLPPSR